ncbi:unannotated protein [freshwater metagenome]|uniref:Unannotated protein n=1 Tax=freshwater metagenome TaxID=449393 RepID=A0A6J7K262_9ZZZZ
MEFLMVDCTTLVDDRQTAWCSFGCQRAPHCSRHRICRGLFNHCEFNHCELQHGNDRSHHTLV